MVKIGLLSKIGAVSGKVKQVAASSLGALKSKASGMISKHPTAAKVLGKAAAVAKPAIGIASKVAKGSVKVAKVAAGLTPVGRTVKTVAAATALGTIGAVAVKKAISRSREKRAAAAQPAKLPTPVEAKKSAGSKAATIAKAALIAGGVGAAAYGVEQIAEKLGVRGGAGFIGARPKKRRKSTKRKSRSRKYKRKSRSRKSSKKIYYTKNKQPYIMKNGRARFISRRSAKTMRRRKGGYQ